MRSAGVRKIANRWLRDAGAASFVVLSLASGCGGSGNALFEDLGPSGGGGSASQGGSGASANSAAGGSDATAGSTRGGSAVAGSSEQGGTGADAGAAAGGALDTGAAGETTSASGSDAGGSGGSGGSGQAGTGGSSACSVVSVPLKPVSPKVMFLVDRSSSMFDIDGEPWAAVRDAALPAMDALDSSLDLGFMAITGTFGKCPMLDELAPSAQNYSAIRDAYVALKRPMTGKSPYMLALTRAGELLDAAPGAGKKYVIFVIDGEPDYCNDGDAQCSIDSVVARLQALRQKGITTLVASLPLSTAGGATQYASAQKSYANAGAGLPTAVVGTSPMGVYYGCNFGDPNWGAEFQASGKPALQALGSYSANPGSAAVTHLDAQSVSSMTTVFRKLFASTKSCVFDLQGSSVALAQASTGIVTLADNALVYAAENGWRMNSATQLELLGGACSSLQAEAEISLQAEFPCAALNP
jgi:hypothetical protein